MRGDVTKSIKELIARTFHIYHFEKIAELENISMVYLLSLNECIADGLFRSYF